MGKGVRCIFLKHVNTVGYISFSFIINDFSEYCYLFFSFI